MTCRYTAAHAYGPVGGENFIINEHLNNPDVWTRPTHPSWKNYIALKDKNLVFDKKGISIHSSLDRVFSSRFLSLTLPRTIIHHLPVFFFLAFSEALARGKRLLTQTYVCVSFAF